MLLVVSCHRGSREAEKPPDVVSSIPATGPIVFMPFAQIGEDRSAVQGPWLIDPETGAMHRLADVDATCASVVRYNDSPHQLYSVDAVIGWSGKRQAFFAQPSGNDVPLVLLGLDGKCAPLWHETYEWTPPPAVAGDGATIARKRHGAIELSAADGTSPRSLAWTSVLSIGGVALSPSGDHVAIVKTFNNSPDYEVVTCDLAGACATAFSAKGTCADLSGRPTARASLVSRRSPAATPTRSRSRRSPIQEVHRSCSRTS